MPDGLTALEHIEAVAAKSRAIKVPMGPSSAGGNGQQMWHVWGEGSGKPTLLLFHGGSGSWIHWIRNVLPLSSISRSTPPTRRDWATAMRPTT